MGAMNREEVIRKISALLALSESDNENEASLAASKAAELMTSYNVEILEVERSTGRKTEDVVQMPCYEATFASGWRGYLAMGCASLNFCKCYVDNQTPKPAEVREKLGPRYTSTKWSRIMIYGRKTNVEAAVRMFQYLEATVLRLGNEARAVEEANRKDFGISKDGLNAWVDSWRKGCTSRLRSRLDERRREQTEGSDGYQGQFAIAVRDASIVLAKEADDYMKSIGMKLVSRKSTAVVNEDAYVKGRRDADTIGLDAQLETR